MSLQKPQVVEYFYCALILVWINGFTQWGQTLYEVAFKFLCI